MKRIAIVTLYGEYNLGNKLQNYAVEYLLKESGCNPTTLAASVYQPLKRRFKYFLLDILSAIPVWKDRRLIEHRMMGKRSRVIAEFSHKYLHYSDRFDYRDKEKLVQINKSYDLFVAGSDQVWGSFIDQDKEAFNYYFLKFADLEKRGSLSPSFGRDTVPDERREEYSQGLKDIRWLTCREKGMQKLIEELSSRDAELLLDPTMAVPIDEWRKIESTPDYEIPSQYILDYRLGTDKDCTDLAVEDIADSIGLKTVNIYNTKVQNEIFEKTGPEEFLWLIDHAALVVTDSFHGCVFSILFNKDFICIDRSETSKSVNMSDRLETLFMKFDLENRFYRKNIRDCMYVTDYSDINRIIIDETEKIRNHIRDMVDGKDQSLIWVKENR